MIEIVKQRVEMPPTTECRYQKDFKEDKWIVTDTETNTVVYRGKFENASLVCHNLNKKHYRNISIL